MTSALVSFRNPPTENLEILEPDPLTIQNRTGDPSACGMPDVIGDVAYFNRLCVSGVPIGCPTTCNYIALPHEDKVATGQVFLNIYDPLSTDHVDRVSVLALYAQLTNPGFPSYDPGGGTVSTFNRLVICPNSNGTSFQILTQSTYPTPNINADIQLTPGGALYLGSSQSNAWRVNASSDSYPYAFQPAPGVGNVDIGTPFYPVSSIRANNYIVADWSSHETGAFKWEDYNFYGNTLSFKKSTGANPPGNAGAGYLKMYVVTGTNANTFKLVVQAGAFGAQMTILDNIPT